MLNKNQEEAVFFKDGPAMVLAGPGSGKTTVITKRIEALIDQGIDPSSILVITFTKAAALEMQTRFLALGASKGGSVSFGTFHSIFFHILCRRYGYKPEDILRASLKIKILKDILRRQCIRICDEDAIDAVLNTISQVKSGKLKLDSISENEYFDSGTRPVGLDEFRNIYAEYCLAMDKNHLIDFDDMVVKAYKLLSEEPQTLSYWQKRFSYILVDEFQDISPIQYEVVRLLAAPMNNLFIVGDDDQSIYGFRGSDPGIMLNFTNDYPMARTICLDTNYRCSREIVDGSINVIQNNKTRFNKTILSPKEASETMIETVEHIDFDNEALMISKMILREHEENGVAFDEIAVLYRNHSLSKKLKDTLIMSGIPLKIKEKSVNIYRGDMVKDILSYIRISQGEGLRGDFINVLNKPDRGLLRQSLDDERPTFASMKEYYRGDDRAIREIERWELLSGNMIKLTPYGILSLIRFGLGYDDYIRQRDEESQSTGKGGGLREEYEKLMLDSKNYNTISQYLRFVEQRMNDDLTKQDEAEKKENGVGFYTLHGSKGLEFKVVYIIGVNEGIIPQTKEASMEVLEEERRLFYVGMTRAKDKLILSYVRKKGNKELIPSRFLDEIVSGDQSFGLELKASSSESK